MWTRGDRRPDHSMPATRDFLQLSEHQLKRERLFRSEAEHRLANFLQLIASNLDGQGRSIIHAEARDAVKFAGNQLMLLSRLHRALGQIDCSNLLVYGRSLAEACAMLQQLALATRGHTLRFVLQAGAEDVRIGPDQAQALTLLTSELVLNAAKHGFSGRHGGTVEVLLGWAGYYIICAVIDNGRALSATEATSDGQGMQVASRLAEEAGRWCRWVFSPGGTEARVSLPITHV